MKNTKKLLNYLKTIELFEYQPEIIALAFCLDADPSEVVGVSVDEAGCDVEEFYRLVCKIDEARLCEEYKLI